MSEQVLFIQGAGEGAYQEDAILAERLRRALGDGYDLAYPAMADEGNAPYEAWKQQIEAELARAQGSVVLAGHSVGASMLLKILADTVTTHRIAGIFLLLATPFWGGDGWLYDGYEELELPADMAHRLPSSVPVFLYHCQDDEVVPFDHLALHARLLPEAEIRGLPKGGHQFDNDLSPIATDIRNLAAT